MSVYHLQIVTAYPNIKDRPWDKEAIKDAINASNAIEMKWSEYFTWEDDEQEKLSRSTAVNHVEREIGEYIHLSKYLSWEIVDLDLEVGEDLIGEEAY